MGASRNPQLSFYIWCEAQRPPQRAGTCFFFGRTNHKDGVKQRASLTWRRNRQALPPLASAACQMAIGEMGFCWIAATQPAPVRVAAQTRLTGPREPARGKCRAHFRHENCPATQQHWNWACRGGRNHGQAGCAVDPVFLNTKRWAGLPTEGRCVLRLVTDGWMDSRSHDSDLGSLRRDRFAHVASCGQGSG